MQEIIKNKQKLIFLLKGFGICIGIITLVFLGIDNPFNNFFKNANAQILSNNSPETFEINLNLNDFNLVQINQDQIKKLYSNQKCYIDSKFSLEEISNNGFAGPEDDYDKDGLSNSLEMILNSNPKSKQTQLSFDDNVLYQDSKSPFNSQEIDKNKIYFIDKSFVKDKGVYLAKLLDEGCKRGEWFFELVASPSLPVPKKMEIIEQPKVNGFELFYKKEKELIKNRELDIYLKVSSENSELNNKERDLVTDKIKVLNTFSIEPEYSQDFLQIYDFLNKEKKLLEEVENKSLIFKELMYLINLF